MILAAGNNAKGSFSAMVCTAVSGRSWKEDCQLRLRFLKNFIIRVYSKVLMRLRYYEDAQM